MNINNYFVFVLGFFCFTNAQAQSEWTNVATSKDGTKWAIQNGSFEFSKTKAGIPIAAVVGRISDPNRNSVSLNKWYVSAEDCSKRMGKVVTTNVSGEYRFESDFVIGSGNIASAMAEAICNVADYIIKQNNDKSM